MYEKTAMVVSVQVGHERGTAIAVPPKAIVMEFEGL